MALFPARTPREIKLLGKALTKADNVLHRKILLMVVNSLQDTSKGSSSLVGHDLLDGAATESEQRLAIAIVSGLWVLLRAILRLPQNDLKTEALVSELKDLKLPQNVIEDIVKVIFGSRRSALNEAALLLRPRLPTLSDFKWRADVSISTSALSRVLEPTVTFEMVLSSSQVRRFEVSMKTFHSLRCNVALVLKEMEDVEKQNVLKAIE